MRRRSGGGMSGRSGRPDKLRRPRRRSARTVTGRPLYRSRRGLTAFGRILCRASEGCPRPRGDGHSLPTPAGLARRLREPPWPLPVTAEPPRWRTAQAPEPPSIEHGSCDSYIGTNSHYSPSRCVSIQRQYQKRKIPGSGDSISSHPPRAGSTIPGLPEASGEACLAAMGYWPSGRRKVSAALPRNQRAVPRAAMLRKARSSTAPNSPPGGA